MQYVNACYSPIRYHRHCTNYLANEKKISPERKIKLHRAEDLRVTTSSSEQSDRECELQFTPNQILQLQQTLPIYP